MEQHVSTLRFDSTTKSVCRSLGTTSLRLGAALLALSCALPTFAAHRAKPAEDEESVLIATREAPANVTQTSDAVDDPDALQPTAESSDHTPEMAANSEMEKSNSQFGEALEKVAESQQPKAWKKAPTSISAVKSGEYENSAGDISAETTDGASRRAAAARADSVPYEPVKFQGVAVGKTTKHELITLWGQAAETAAAGDGQILSYRKTPFQAVELLCDQKSVVTSIKITLAAPLEAKKLTEQLSLEKIASVTISDPSDRPIGLAFPDRGVLFMYANAERVTPVDEDKTAAASMMVSHVVIQPLDAKTFMLRGEKYQHSSFTQSIGDLKLAISLDPEYAYAYCALAKVYLATGQADLADAAAAEACDIEPLNAAYQLCRAECRELLAEYDDSTLKVRAVLDREDIGNLDRAQALHQMGRLAALGDGEIASKAIPFENRAIEAADKLATSKNAKERRAAKQILVEAHVAIAEEIARQTYNQKVESLKQWIGRASGIAEEYIANDKGSVELRLHIAQRVLAALASFRPTLDPAPWVAEAEEAAKTLMAESDDELYQEHVKWELGIAYLNALRVEHTRRQTDMALKYGQQAIDNLATGAACRQAVHSSEQLVGQLYFQMGAVYAVHKLDHAKATQWYEKAAPLLLGTRPASELYAPRREGEMLVSMGVSFWQLGNQPRALDLTQSGVSLVEAAVENGVLAKSTLAVPYGNLATMYEQMGETTNAAKYADLAKSVGGSEPKQAARQSASKRPGTARNSKPNANRSR